MKNNIVRSLVSHFRAAVIGSATLAALNTDKPATPSSTSLDNIATNITAKAPLTEASPDTTYDLIIQGKGGYKNPWIDPRSRSMDMQEALMRSQDPEDIKLQQGFKKWLTQFNTCASATLFEKVDFVNKTINNTTTYKSDMEVFGVNDYAPAVAKTVSMPEIYADCEDYALMKYYALQHLGVEKQRLSILLVSTLGVDSKNINHAVLAVDTTRAMDGRNALILDLHKESELTNTKNTNLAILEVIREDKGVQTARLVKASPLASPSHKTQRAPQR